MRIHRRNTYQDGANRMLFDHSWHSSVTLERIQIGDILRIRNKDTFEVIDWEVTDMEQKLNSEEAEKEWQGYPFGNIKKAERFNYFPYVIHNLRKIKEYPPKKPTQRFISSDVRIHVWVRDGGKCKKCGSKEELEFDHVIPVAKGGSNSEKNIEILCKQCNRKKLDKIE